MPPRKRIRILFVNCPRLDVTACKYLILAQNKVQGIFQFEAYLFSIFAEQVKAATFDTAAKLLKRWSTMPLPFRKWAERRYAARADRVAAPFLAVPMGRQSCVGLMKDIVIKHDQWLSGLPRSYGNWSIERAPTIVVTETPLEGGYYGWSEEDLAIISISQWQRYFAPPSVLEFILSSSQRYSLRMSFVSEIGSHYPTRGCIWDFNANVGDARAGILVGYLCDSCEFSLLSAGVTEEEVTALKRLLTHEWVGNTETAGSVAGNLKRVFSYDLSRTKGLHASMRERLSDALTSETAKWIVAVVLGGIVVWLFRVIKK